MSRKEKILGYFNAHLQNLLNVNPDLCFDIEYYFKPRTAHGALRYNTVYNLDILMSEVNTIVDNNELLMKTELTKLENNWSFQKVRTVESGGKYDNVAVLVLYHYQTVFALIPIPFMMKHAPLDGYIEYMIEYVDELLETTSSDAIQKITAKNLEFITMMPSDFNELPSEEKLVSYMSEAQSYLHDSMIGPITNAFNSTRADREPIIACQKAFRMLAEQLKKPGYFSSYSLWMAAEPKDRVGRLKSWLLDNDFEDKEELNKIWEDINKFLPAQ